MTKLLDDALEAVRKTPPETQNAVARLMLDMVHDGQPEPIPAEHLAAVLEGEAEADRGEFATDEEVAEAFRSFGR